MARVHVLSVPFPCIRSLGSRVHCVWAGQCVDARFCGQRGGDLRAGPTSQTDEAGVSTPLAFDDCLFILSFYKTWCFILFYRNTMCVCVGAEGGFPNCLFSWPHRYANMRRLREEVKAGEAGPGPGQTEVPEEKENLEEKLVELQTRPRKARKGKRKADKRTPLELPVMRAVGATPAASESVGGDTAGAVPRQSLASAEDPSSSEGAEEATGVDSVLGEGCCGYGG
jgi:hypothetical protein